MGFMGTGKSVVGRRLARRLKRRFFETDRWIVRQAGKSISRIFAEEGEPVFRDLETAACRWIASRRGWVVATGGGVLGRAANLELLQSSGILICLQARPDVILARTAPWEDRPMLSGASDPEARIRALLNERRSQYSRSETSIDTSDLGVDQVVDAICDALKSRWGSDPTPS